MYVHLVYRISLLTEEGGFRSVTLGDLDGQPTHGTSENDKTEELRERMDREGVPA